MTSMPRRSAAIAAALLLSACDVITGPSGGPPELRVPDVVSVDVTSIAVRVTNHRNGELRVGSCFNGTIDHRVGDAWVATGLVAIPDLCVASARMIGGGKSYTLHVPIEGAPAAGEYRIRTNFVVEERGKEDRLLEGISNTFRVE